MTIENYTAGQQVRNDYASMAYWYQKEVSSDFFGPTTLEQRRPLPNRGYDSVEIEWVITELPAGASFVEDERLSFDKGVELVGLGKVFEFDIEFDQDGLYTIIPMPAPVSGAGAVELIVGGKPVIGDKFRMKKGYSKVGVRLKKERVVMDFFRIERVGD